MAALLHVLLVFSFAILLELMSRWEKGEIKATEIMYVLKLKQLFSRLSKSIVVVHGASKVHINIFISF